MPQYLRRNRQLFLHILGENMVADRFFPALDSGAGSKAGVDWRGLDAETTTGVFPSLTISISYLTPVRPGGWAGIFFDPCMIYLYQKVGSGSC